LALGYSGKVGVVTDKNVGRLFGARVMRSLKSAGLIAHLTIIPAGERTKR
jgi:3-dehydroquinate synthetase